MTAFILLSAPFRAVFALWSLLLCLTDIGSAVLAAAKKRIGLTLSALALLLPVYLLWQIIFDLSLFGQMSGTAAISRAAGGFPWLVWLAVFLILTVSALLLFGYNVRYDRTFITPRTIKLFLDRIPCGICCWRDNGRVLFSNICMNRLCESMTGGPLLHGDTFRDAVKTGILPAEGRVWRFSVREFSFGSGRLHEMIASDITDEYAKTRALEADKAELSQLNRELGTYYFSIDETVRRQEILQAKVNIHDEMNRLMLSTLATDPSDTAELDRIFSLWEQNALLLCMEADGAGGTRAAERLEKLADALKIRIDLAENLPAVLTDGQRDLFLTAAQEALVNAVKHAGADSVTVSFEESDTSVLCRFANGGTIPAGPVPFSGGLRNLASLAEKQGAALSAEAGESFVLTLTFPKREKNQPNG